MLYFFFFLLSICCPVYVAGILTDLQYSVLYPLMLISACLHLLCLLASPGMSDAAIMELNLPTGIPIVYELDANLKPIKPMSFLGDEETVKKAMAAVAAQGKAKK